MNFERLLTRILCFGAICFVFGCASVHPNGGLIESDRPKEMALRPPDPSAHNFALVLSGGGARGFAHLGVIKVLMEAGLGPALIVGTSAGSIVASGYAAGLSYRELIAAAEKSESLADVDFVLPNLGLPFLRGELGFMRGQRVKDWVNAMVSNRPLESLSRRVAIVATDLQTGRAIAFTHGNTGFAVLMIL